MSTTFLDVRQSEWRATATMIGGSANITGDTLFANIDALSQKLVEDRNVIITDGGAISLSSNGQTLSFTEPLNLVINQTAAGGTPSTISLGSTSVTFTATGYLWYAVVNRTAPSATTSTVAPATGLPTATFANQDVFLLGVRVDSADGTKTVYLRGGTVVFAGQSVRLGSPSALDSTFSVANSTDPTKHVAFSVSGSSTATTLTLAAAVTANRTITFPDVTSTLVARTSVDQGANRLQNKDLDASSVDFVDPTDTTKKIAFSASGSSTATTLTLASSNTAARTITFPDATGTVALLTATQTLTNTTLSLIKTNVVTDSTTTGTAATLQAADILAGVVRLTNASLVSISGIPAGASGQQIIVENQTGNTVTVNNNDSGATAANRIYTGISASTSFATNGSMTLVYDTTASRWMLTSITTSVGSVTTTTVQFTSPGSGTWTVPAGVTTIWCTIAAGGGGGGSGANSTGSSGPTGGQTGGGGGAGCLPYSFISTVTPGASISYTVGAGGAGGNGVFANTNGNSGSQGGATYMSGLNIPGISVGNIYMSGAFGGGGGQISGSGGSGGYTPPGAVNIGTVYTNGGAGGNPEGGNAQVGQSSLFNIGGSSNNIYDPTSGCGGGGGAGGGSGGSSPAGYAGSGSGGGISAGGGGGNGSAVGGSPSGSGGGGGGGFITITYIT